MLLSLQDNREHTLASCRMVATWTLSHTENLEDCRLLFYLSGTSETLFPQSEANNDSHILRDLSLFSKVLPILVLATQVSPTHSVQGQGSSTHMCSWGQGYCEGPAPVKVVGRRTVSIEARLLLWFWGNSAPQASCPTAMESPRKKKRKKKKTSLANSS